MVKSDRFLMIPQYGDSQDPIVRAKYGYLEATVSILGNTLLFFLKLLLGLFINSIALIADGVHSLSDVSTSGVVIFGFRIAKKQPDKEHPYGHGRAEYIATLIIATLLIITGFGFIQQSIERIIDPQNITHQEYAIIISVIVMVSAVLKELMARFSFAISKRIKSDVLRADAWHHRSDAISSIGVAISIIVSRYGFPILDPIFGII
ncbi:MAG: cation transporter, partial [Thermoplasmatales archaeon]